MIAGAGVFGLTAAVELRRRGHAVLLLDPGPLPRPQAASVDLSRAVRADYGDDLFYTALVEAAVAGWEAWEAQRQGLWHPTGFLFLTRAPMQPGGFEHASFHCLRARGYPLQRVGSARIAERFPAFDAARYQDGYVNPRAGWVDAAATVELLLEQARAAGVVVRERVALAALDNDGTRILGVRTGGGERLAGDAVVVAAGAWTPVLLPWLEDRITPVAQPVLYFRAREPDLFTPPRFLPFGADIAATGWYGFPAVRDGVVKIANHGPGLRLSPDAPRIAPEAAVAQARAFLGESLPRLADAPLEQGKLCFYGDSFDGDFWIDRDPERAGLVVAAGGSGHAFKLAPLLGAIIADVVEGRPSPRAERFRWRPRGGARAEQARRRD